MSSDVLDPFRSPTDEHSVEGAAALEMLPQVMRSTSVHEVPRSEHPLPSWVPVVVGLTIAGLVVAVYVWLS